MSLLHPTQPRSTTRHARPARLAATGVALASVLLGGLLVNGATATSQAAAPARTTAPAPATAPASAAAWLDSASSWTNLLGGRPKVVGLRYAQHPRFDRVVVDLRGLIPSWRTRYQRTFHYDGSGLLVPIRGRSGLSLTLSAVAHDAAGHNVYTGPRIARPGFSTLKALAMTGDFEGQVSFAFALRRRAEYRVFRLHSPQRLVIDFRR